MKDRLSNGDLQRLRVWRGSRERDVSIGKIVEDLTRQAADRQRRLGGIGDLWEEVVPVGLRKGCEVEGMAGGVLMVKAASPAARFQFDRWLRNGGEAQLSRRGGVKRVRMT